MSNFQLLLRRRRCLSDSGHQPFNERTHFVRARTWHRFLGNIWDCFWKDLMISFSWHPEGYTFLWTDGILWLKNLQLLFQCSCLICLAAFVRVYWWPDIRSLILFKPQFLRKLRGMLDLCCWRSSDIIEVIASRVIYWIKVYYKGLGTSQVILVALGIEYMALAFELFVGQCWLNSSIIMKLFNDHISLYN